jgi:hypothetical protein
MGVRHKKTRKEKIIADYRHQVYVLKNKDLPLNSATITAPIGIESYSDTYIFKDILKTGILTGSIIAAQIVLFFLLRNHVITLPIVKY